MIEAELPDGTVLEFPEGTSQDVIQRAVQNRLGVKTQQKTSSPTFGQMFKDEVLTSAPVAMLRGAKDIIDTGAYFAAKGFDKLAGTNEAARVKALNEAGKREFEQATERTQNPLTPAGRVAGQIIGTAPVGGVLAGGLSMVPGVAQRLPSLINALRTGGLSVGGAKGLGATAARVVGGAATGGAAAGLVNPEDAATGAMIGGAIPVAAQAAGAGGRALGRALRPGDDMAQLAQKAQQYGIPVGIGDITQNRAIQATRSILSDAPLTGGMAQGAREAKQQAFNAAVGETFGAKAPKLTTEVVDAAKQRMGAEFDRIWNNNALRVTPEMINKVQEIRAVSNKLPRNEGASLAAEIDDLFSKMTPDASGELQIPGDVANKFQQYLRRRAEGSAGIRNELGDLRQTIISAFNASVSPADAAALTLNRRQYKAFKTIEPILKSAELGVAGRMPGDVPAALLPGAVSKNYSNVAGTPLADLSQIGSQFLVDRVPQTGGSMRAALQNTAIGGALMGGAMVNPLATAAAVPTAIGLQSALSNPNFARAVMGQKGAISPSLIEALRAIQVSAPVISAQ